MSVTESSVTRSQRGFLLRNDQKHSSGNAADKAHESQLSAAQRSKTNASIKEESRGGKAQRRPDSSRKGGSVS